MVQRSDYGQYLEEFGLLLIYHANPGLESQQRLGA